MTRCVSMDKATNDLLLEFSSKNSERVSQTISRALMAYMLPSAEDLRIEAIYIIQLRKDKALDPWTVKQSISRGVRWMGEHTTMNTGVLKAIAAHHDPISAEAVLLSAGSSMAEMLTRLQRKINDTDEAYGVSKCEYKDLLDDIISRWPVLGQDRETYDFLAALIFSQEAHTPFTWTEGVLLLKEMELQAQMQFSR